MYNLEEIKSLPITKVAAQLGIRVLRGNKAMCFGRHDKKTPSLSFQVKKNFWKCFGCDRSGDTIKLVEQFLDCDFNAAIRWFESQFGLQVRKGSRPKAHPGRRQAIRPTLVQSRADQGGKFEADSELYAWFLRKCGPVSQPTGLKYLLNHGIPREDAIRFGVRELRNPLRALRCLVERWGTARVVRSGLALEWMGQAKRLIWSSYALVFPFYEDKSLVYLQGRVFQGDRRYLNLIGVPTPLFNIDRLRTLPARRRIYVCEGVPDALALEAKNLPAVAVLGASSFRAGWIDALMPYDITLMPDVIPVF